MITILLVANGLFALVSGAFSLVAAVRPAFGIPAGELVTTGVRLYSTAYALRAAPLGLAAALVMVTGAHPAGLTPMLIVLGVAQAGDALIGARQRIWGMAVGAGAGALLHLASTWVLAGR